MLSVLNKPFMRSIAMLNVVMLNVIMLFVAAPIGGIFTVSVYVFMSTAKVLIKMRIILYEQVRKSIIAYEHTTRQITNNKVK